MEGNDRSQLKGLNQDEKRGAGSGKDLESLSLSKEGKDKQAGESLGNSWKPGLQTCHSFLSFSLWPLLVCPLTGLSQTLFLPMRHQALPHDHASVGPWPWAGTRYTPSPRVTELDRWAQLPEEGDANPRRTGLGRPCRSYQLWGTAVSFLHCVLASCPVVDLSHLLYFLKPA